MGRRVALPSPGRPVWRISTAASLEEFVDPAKLALTVPSDQADLCDSAVSTGWIVSSFELLNGIDIVDDGEGAPDDLFDRFFARPVARLKPAERAE